jgi:hypothetical protein
MSVELVDKRIAEVLSREEYMVLKEKAGLSFDKIQQELSGPAFQDVFELLMTMREIETCLLEERFREKYAGYAHVAMGTCG